MIQFATPETIKSIKNPHPIPQDRTVSDHVLGGPGPTWEPILKEGKWLDFLWADPEIQRVDDGDLYWCVTFSHNSAWRFIWRVRYQGEDFNTSERFPAIGAGTQRGRGIGKSALMEWCRQNGFVLQADCPTPNTLDAAYAPLDKALFAKGKANLNTVEIGYKYLENNSEAVIKAGLAFSPVQVDVQNYSFNAQGYIINNTANPDYVHENLVAQDMGGFWASWDSENKQWLKYDKSYRFGSPTIHSIKKKVPMLYKKNGQRAIAVKMWNEPALIAFSDGVLAGGDTFKSLFGVSDYSQLPRQDVEEWPFPIKYILHSDLFTMPFGD